MNAFEPFGQSAAVKAAASSHRQKKKRDKTLFFFFFGRPKQRAAFSTTRGACFFVQGCIKHGLGVQHASFLSARSQSTGRDASHGSFGWNSQTFTTTGFIQ